MSKWALQSVRAFVMGDLQEELDALERFLIALPEDRFDWRPHDKSFSLGELAFHATNVINWQRFSLDRDALDMAEFPPPEKGATPAKSDLMETFANNRQMLADALAKFDFEEIEREWQLKMKGVVVMSMKRFAVLRRFGISHLIHHRAQLGLYLRMLDMPVPNTYGPTADNP